MPVEQAKANISSVLASSFETKSTIDHRNEVDHRPPKRSRPSSFETSRPPTILRANKRCRLTPNDAGRAQGVTPWDGGETMPLLLRGAATVCTPLLHTCLAIGTTPQQRALACLTPNQCPKLAPTDSGSRSRWSASTKRIPPSLPANVYSMHHQRDDQHAWDTETGTRHVRGSCKGQRGRLGRHSK